MNLSALWEGFKNAFKALRNGEFLLRIRADKYYMHIMYLFLLMWVTILLSLQVDKTLTKAGDNQAAIDQLRIHHAEKEAALVKLHSASAAETRLKELGVNLTLPQEPATVIKKK
jgi:hypothetical protein